MDSQKVLAKFAVFAGLSGEGLAGTLPLCMDAVAEISAGINPEALPAPDEDILVALAAALAYYRYVLLSASGSSLPRVGHVALADTATAGSALALLEQYRAAAAPYLLHDGFAIRQVSPQ